MKRFPLSPLPLYPQIVFTGVCARGLPSCRAPGIILGNIFVWSMKFYNLNHEVKSTLVLTGVGCELVGCRPPDSELVEYNWF